MPSTSFTFAGRDLWFSAYHCFRVTNHTFWCLYLTLALLSPYFAFLPWKIDGDMEEKSMWCCSGSEWALSCLRVPDVKKQRFPDSTLPLYLLKAAGWKWHGGTDMTEWLALLHSNLWICLFSSDILNLSLQSCSLLLAVLSGHVNHNKFIVSRGELG